MNKRTQAAYTLALMGIIGTVGATSAFAATTTTPSTKNDNRESHMQDHAAMQTALQNNDYAAFTKLLADKPRPADAPEITAEVFAKLVQAEQLRQSGDMAGAEKIMSDAGFKKPDHDKHAGPRGDRPLPPNLTAEQKAAFEKAKPLFQSGKFDEAKKILDDAGITPPSHKNPPTTK